MARSLTDARWLLSPGLAEAPVLDVLCTHFVLTLTLRQAGRFNLRRDWNSLLSLVGRHLVWPQPVLGRVRTFLAQRCKGNPQWKGHELLTDMAFLERHGPWRGPYEEGTLFFYIDEYIKDAPKDLLTVLGSTCDWIARRLKKESTLVQKNIDALAGLLQLNPAERALLLYGTLARYQRDLRGLLVEFKVSNAQEAYAALAAVAGVEAGEVAEALRAGSRLERIGMVENLISEQNITDLADLMKVSDQLPPVLMREYRAPGELMAVFTRPVAPSELQIGDFAFVAEDAAMLTALLKNATARKEPGVNVLLYGPPGTGKTELAKVCASAAGLSLYEVEYADRDGNSLSGRDRYRSLQISQVFLKGSPAVALLFDEVEDVFPPISSEAAQLIARLDSSDGSGGGVNSSVSGKAWVNQILETNPVPVIWITNRIEQIDPAFRRRFQYHLMLKSPAARCAAGPGDARPGRCARERRFRRQAGRASRPDTGADPHGRAFCPARAAAGCRGCEPRGADRAPARQRRQGPGQRAGRTRRAQRGHLVRSVAAERGVALRGAAHRRSAQAPRPRHAVLPWCARHGEDGAGGTHRAGPGQRPDDPPDQRHRQQVRGRDRAEHGAHVRRGAEREAQCCCSTRRTAFCAAAGWPSATTRSPKSTRCCRAWNALRRFHLHHEPLRRPGRSRLAALHLQGSFSPPDTRTAAAHVRGRGPGRPERCPDGRAAHRLGALDELAPGDFAAVQRQMEVLGAVLEPDEFLSQLESEHRVKPGVRQRRGIGFQR
jgi:hypothetical protein